VRLGRGLARREARKGWTLGPSPVRGARERAAFRSGCDSF